MKVYATNLRFQKVEAILIPPKSVTIVRGI